MEFYIKVTSIDKHQNVQYYGILARFKDSRQELQQDEEEAFTLARMALPDEAILFADFITKKEYSREFEVHGISS
jgi:ABC-type phosphate transport system auxiliary subunit